MLYHEDTNMMNSDSKTIEMWIGMDHLIKFGALMKGACKIQQLKLIL